MLGVQSEQLSSQSLSQSVRNILQLPLPSGWSISGDLQALLANNPATDIVRYKKDRVVVSSGTVTVLSIEVDRKHAAEGVAQASPTISGIKVYKRADTNTLVFNLEFLDPHGLADKIWKRLKYDILDREGFLIDPMGERFTLNINLVELFCTERLEYTNKGHKNHKDCSFSIQSGLTSRSFLSSIFDFFVGEKMLTDHEAKYFQAICGKPTLQRETDLLNDMKMNIEMKQYDDAIRTAIEIDCNKEKLRRNRIADKEVLNSNRYACALMKLGQELKTSMPLKAYAVFKIAHSLLGGHYHYSCLTFDERLEIACNLSAALLQKEANEISGVEFIQVLTLLVELSREELSQRIFEPIVHLLDRFTGFDWLLERTVRKAHKNSINGYYGSIIITMATTLYQQEKLLQDPTILLKKGDDYKKIVCEKVLLALAQDVQRDVIHMTSDEPLDLKGGTEVLRGNAEKEVEKDALTLPPEWTKSGEFKALDLDRLHGRESSIVYTIQKKHKTVSLPEAEQKLICEAESVLDLKRIMLERFSSHDKEIVVSKLRLYFKETSCDLVKTLGRKLETFFSDKLHACIDVHDHTISFTISKMRKHHFDSILDFLKSENIFSQNEINYLSAVCEFWHKKASATEQRLLDEMDQNIHCQKYGKAIEIAKKIEWSWSQWSFPQVRSNEVAAAAIIFANQFNEAGAAYVLGKRLMEVDPIKAIDAFRMITNNSPYYVSAKKHIVTIVGEQLSKLSDRDLNSSDTVIKVRIEMIRSLLYSSEELGDYEHALPFVEILAGFDPLDPAKKLFDAGFTIKNEAGLLQMFIQMADMIRTRHMQIQSVLNVQKKNEADAPPPPNTSTAQPWLPLRSIVPVVSAASSAPSSLDEIEESNKMGPKGAAFKP